MNGKANTIGWLALVALALGFLVTQQILLTAQINRSAQIREGLALSYLLTRAYRQNEVLQNRISGLQRRIQFVANPGNLGALRAQVQSNRQRAGLTPVSGMGIEVIIHDATQPVYPGEPSMYQLVHDQYVLHIVSLLIGAGAKGVSINGQRYVSSTAIFCAGPTIRVNGVPYASPYVVRAVGNPVALMKALQQDADVQGWSQLVSIRYHFVSHTEIPSYTLPPHFSSVKPVKIGT